MVDSSEHKIANLEHNTVASAKQVVLVDDSGTAYTAGSAPTYTTRLDETSTTDVTYVGKAVVGSSEASAVWQIQQIDETGATLKVLFADGDTSFNNVWADRVSLSYS